MAEETAAACGRSCIDCGIVKCRTGEGSYPPFCLTTAMTDVERAAIFGLYAEEENRAAMTAAAAVECEGYGRLTRVEETMAFARKMGFHRLGIATCVGLLGESRTLARILRANGFEVFGVACKAGAIGKREIGLDPAFEAVGKNICDPIYQARVLAAAGTELNIAVGLCVGHDSLFYKYSEALTTTLVAKDRVLAHNPAGALYLADGYYKTKLFPQE